MRVYRAEHQQIYFLRCSLTIREGISPYPRHASPVQWFPHYTWGYIEPNTSREVNEWVPSLYVRVYRDFHALPIPAVSSLTIREGISYNFYTLDARLQFPHYTWGYIDFGNLLLLAWFVPSLYVRVYRSFVVLSALWLCSLTIREGISITSQISLHHIWFPHYTWGYIVDELEQELSGDVPSLYVRVYRNAVNDWQQERGSLTIREGISTGKKTLYQA